MLEVHKYTKKVNDGILTKSDHCTMMIDNSINAIISDK